MKNKNALIKGQSLFEVVVALAIAAIVIFALVALTSSAIRNTNFSRDKTLAARFAQEATEWLRSQRDEDITAFKDAVTTSASSAWCLDTLSFTNLGECGPTEFIPGTQFLREVVLTSSLLGGKTIVEADISVSWQSSTGMHEVRSVTNLSDWRER